MTLSKPILGGGLVLAASLFVVLSSFDSESNSDATGSAPNSVRIINPGQQGQAPKNSRAKDPSSEGSAPSGRSLDVRVMTRQQLEEEVRLSREASAQAARAVKPTLESIPPLQQTATVHQTATGAELPLSSEEQQAAYEEGSRRGMDQAQVEQILQSQNPSTVRAMLAAPKEAPVQAPASTSAADSPANSGNSNVLSSENSVNVYEEARQKLANDPNFQDPAALEAAKAERFQAYLDSVHAEEERQRSQR